MNQTPHTTPSRRRPPARAGLAASLALGAAALTALAAPPAVAAPELVARSGLVPRGEGHLALGAGAWVHSGGGLTVAQVDLRFGLTDRIELRALLPGLAVEVLRETERRPGLVTYLGTAEVGFSTLDGATFAYQLGLRLTKRLWQPLRLSLCAELRHRALGGAHAELTVLGPMPPDRAGLFTGDVVLQLHPTLAVTGSLGYAAALGAGPSIGFGSVGLVGTVANRVDLYAHALLERSRPEKFLTPAFFGGIGIAFP